MDEKMGPINYNLFYKKNIPPEIFVVFKNLIQKLETFTQNLLDKNKIHLEKLAGELLEKETIIYDDIIRILPKELKDSIDNFDS